MAICTQPTCSENSGEIVPFVCDTAAWEEAYAFMLALCDREPESDHAREWRREALYDERMNRYSRHPD
jgi:hypothetical protein